MTDAADISPGRYIGRAVSSAWRALPNGTPYLSVVFELVNVVGCPRVSGRLFFNSDTEAAVDGRTAYDRSVASLRAMGFEGDVDESIPPIGYNEMALTVVIGDSGFPFAIHINAKWGTVGRKQTKATIADLVAAAKARKGGTAK